MASWMVHLRVADKLLDQIPKLSPVEFIVGNIAPDSGVPNDDWSQFTPSTLVSHFKTEGEKANPELFASRYFTAARQKTYTDAQYAFYLGYLVHLITDVLWVRDIYAPSKLRFADERARDPENFIWKLKEDWYDLDYKYLRDHPGFRAFRVYLGAVGFINTFMEEFSPDAFDNRRAYITSFYLQENNHLDREYPYLTEAEMDGFVNTAVAEILAQLQKYCVHPL
ncbi:MAG: zinc dependent phospholipase C family protein [Faecousia sp.]